jgi:hypothetical protein
VHFLQYAVHHRHARFHRRDALIRDLHRVISSEIKLKAQG